jgi:hypothetical protein
MSDSNEEPGIDSNIRRILSGISALELNVTNITVELTDLRADVTTFRTDVMARIDRLQDALTEQRQSDVVTFGAAERAEQIAKAAREDNLSLGEQLTALARMVRRLQTRVDQLEEGRGEGSPQ